MTTPTPTAVFVYGTLRPGHGNHRWTVGDTPHTAEHGTLFDWLLLGALAPFPYAVPEPGATTIGDVLTFAPEYWPHALAACDGLEGYPHHYDRRVVDVLLDNGRTVEAWVYTPADARRARSLTPVPGGDWTAHRSAVTR